MSATAILVLANMTSLGIFHLGEGTVKVEGQRGCMSVQRPNDWKNQGNFSKLQLFFSWEELVILWPCQPSLLAGKWQLLGKLYYSQSQRQQQLLLSAHIFSPLWGIADSHHRREDQCHEAEKSQRIHVFLPQHLRNGKESGTASWNENVFPCILFSAVHTESWRSEVGFPIRIMPLT